jgi:uncharacterized protein (DUF2141 family)
MLTQLIGVLIVSFWFQHHATLTVEIKNIPSIKGNIIVYLYDNEKDFPKKSVMKKIIPVTEKNTKVVFNNLSEGYYAVNVLHDKNANQKPDFYLFGPPKEKIITSNNAKGFFSPPGYNDAKFYIRSQKVIVLDFDEN